MDAEAAAIEAAEDAAEAKRARDAKARYSTLDSKLANEEKLR